MASIKLKHSSGNGTILNSPAANPSSDITLKLPSTTGSAGQVLSVASANHSSTNAELEFAAGGKILQVKYNQSTSSTTTTASRTQLLTLSINLASASNPVYVIGRVTIGATRNTNGYTQCSIFRGTTYAEDLADTELDRSFSGTTDGGTNTYNSYTVTALDTGNTSATQTYALTFGKGSTGTTSAETDARYSLTLMEVAA